MSIWIVCVVSAAFAAPTGWLIGYFGTARLCKCRSCEAFRDNMRPDLCTCEQIRKDHR